MPKATLTYDLPEEREEFNAAAHGQDWTLLVGHLDGELRSALKYGPLPGKDGGVEPIKTAEEAFEWVRDRLRSLASDYNVEIG
jgi:hypothetical protein